NAEHRDSTLHQIGSQTAIPIKLEVQGIGHGQHRVAIRHALVEGPTDVGHPLIHVHLAAGEAEAALAAERHPFLFQTVRAQIRRIARLQGATAEHFVDDGLHVAILVPQIALLEGPPVIAEDLLEGVLVDPLHCGGHRARLYHLLAAEASRFFTLRSPSLPIASPVGTGRIRAFEKGNSYTLKLLDSYRKGYAENVEELVNQLRRAATEEPDIGVVLAG